MIKGVDRSHLNARIPLASLAKLDISFIWFKGTQGTTYQDPTFNAAWQEVKRIAGNEIGKLMKRGVYHFFDPRVDGIAQAKNYLSLKVDFTSPGCLPPCVDVEDLVGTDAADTARINQWVADNWQLALQRLEVFLGYIKAQTGKDCIIYSYNGYMREYLHSHPFPNNPMWLSSILTAKNPHCPVRYDDGQVPAFWQYTYNWNGTDMDGNYFMSDMTALDSLANIKNIT